MNIKRSFFVVMLACGMGVQLNLVAGDEPAQHSSEIIDEILDTDAEQEKSIKICAYLNTLAAQWAKQRPAAPAYSSTVRGCGGIGLGAAAFYLGCVVDSRIATVLAGGSALASAYSLASANKAFEVQQLIQKIDYAYANEVLGVLMRYQGVRIVQTQLTHEAHQL